MFADADRAITRRAAHQDGVVSRAQALAAGLTARQIRLRCEVGRWLRLDAGVYLLDTGPATARQRLRAALLKMPGSVASHQSAAELFRMDIPAGETVAVTVPWPGRQVSALARVHRSRNLTAGDVLSLEGLAVTSRCRTLVDLAGCLPAPRLARLVDDQLVARLVRLEDLRAAYRRIGCCRPDGRVLRQLLEERAPGFVAPESELEAVFLGLMERHGLPAPVRQWAAPWLAPERGRVDFAYPMAQLVVEVDGRRWHSRDEAIRRDRWRDRQAQLVGWMVLRYGYEEITSRGEEVVIEVLRAIAQRSGACSAA